MLNIKEIKSVKLTPFTKMSASIYGILGFIGAILMLIVLSIVQAAGVTSQLGPQFAHFNLITGLGIPLVILLPIGAFFTTIAVSFFSVMLYNALVPRLGGVKLELEGTEVQKIPVVSFALILSAIGAIWAFIAGLVLAAVVSPLFSLISTLPEASNITANITNVSGAAMPSGVNFGSMGIIVTLLLVIGLPILAFVFGFIWNALFALIYNYISTRVAKINLEFNQITGQHFEITHIPVIPTALAVSITYAILGLLGILSGDFTQFISNFVLYFIETALIAYFYNYLAPKIGSIKLDLD